MKIFNSLGSNFSWGVSFRALFSFNNRARAAQLQKDLAEKYQGRATLTYKGRQALRLALEISGLPKGLSVGINGFTCYVVYQAIERAGYKPVFIDIAADSLHFDKDGLESAHNNQPLAALVIQNTFGIPCEFEQIEEFARNNKILLIEDLAHCVGSVYADGREAGTVGDLVMLSLSQDKTLDAVAGGALIDRRHVPAVITTTNSYGLISNLKLKFYPVLTHFIRSTYGLGIGRVMHKLFRSFKLLARPMDEVSEIAQNIATGSLANFRWQQRAVEFEHRRKIASIYRQKLPAGLTYKASGDPVYVRFPVKADGPNGLQAILRQSGFFLGDTWYDAPAAPAKYMSKTNYRSGQCPNAEKAISQILNLPVHQEISEELASKICGIINQWHK